MKLENMPEMDFKKQLLARHAANNKSLLITKEEYFNLIEELKRASEETEQKTNRQYYIIKN